MRRPRQRLQQGWARGPMRRGGGALRAAAATARAAPRAPATARPRAALRAVATARPRAAPRAAATARPRAPVRVRKQMPNEEQARCGQVRSPLLTQMRPRAHKTPQRRAQTSSELLIVRHHGISMSGRHFLCFLCSPSSCSPYLCLKKEVEVVTAKGTRRPPVSAQQGGFRGAQAQAGPWLWLWPCHPLSNWPMRPIKIR